MSTPRLAGFDGRKLPAPVEDAGPSDSASSAIRFGLALLAIAFLGFGGWAVCAPLNAAVMGDAVVKVDGNRKSVQHLDGGIVQRILVKDGDAVGEGDTLVVLDGTQARSEYQIYAQQYYLLLATAARLTAEMDGADAVSFPAELLSRRDDPLVEAALRGQETEFRARRTALEGQEQSIRQRIAQFEAQIAGLAGQIRAYRDQLASINAEKDSLADLLARQLVPRARILQLERTALSLEGQIAGAEASIAQARQAIGEQANLLGQVRKDRLAEVSRDLRDAQSKLLDVGPRMQNAAVQISRLEIRSPYSGKVVGMKVFSTGGVIGKGEKILDIVPDRDQLTVEAQIRVEDISDIRPGMAAEVHFTSYKQRTIPLIHGTVSNISADRLTDERTGIPYYTVMVGVTDAELAAAPQIRLYPGMPAMVVITTEARTALDYLVGPFVASLDRSFRQR
jgi:HlyD family type I secretion membrane fusion protein